MMKSRKTAPPPSEEGDEKEGADGGAKPENGRLERILG